MARKSQSPWQSDALSTWQEQIDPNIKVDKSQSHGSQKPFTFCLEWSSLKSDCVEAVSFAQISFSPLNIQFLGIVHFLSGGASSNAAFHRAALNRHMSFELLKFDCVEAVSFALPSHYLIPGTCTFSFRRVVQLRCILSAQISREDSLHSSSQSSYMNLSFCVVCQSS